jgi:hypothetical protein
MNFVYYTLPTHYPSADELRQQNRASDRILDLILTAFLEDVLSVESFYDTCDSLKNALFS